MKRAKYILFIALTVWFSAVNVQAKEHLPKDSVIVEKSNGMAITLLEDDNPLLVEKRRNERGLSNLTSKFIPKRQWIVGALASYTTHKHDNFSALVIEGVNSLGYSVKFSPMFAYAIANNMAIGGRCEYSRSLLAVSNGEFSYGDDETGVQLEVDDYYIINQRFSSMLIWRQYLPLGASKRFALFNETRLEVGYAISKYAMDHPAMGTYARTLDYGVGINPGIIAFATNQIAVEVSVGVFGVYYSTTKQIHNQVDLGKINSTMVDCRINLLAIGLGVSYYF